MTNDFLYNSLTWKSFISSAAKNIKEHDGIYSWVIRSKYQVAFTRPLTTNDLDYLTQFGEFSSYYVSTDDIGVLESKFKIDKHRDNSIIIPIENFSLVGNSYTGIRNAVNRNAKQNLTILSDLKNLNDAMDCLKRWDDTSGEKHFQVRTGKNRYFFKNEFHKEGISVFIYDKDKLIAFGVLSQPNLNGCSTYVIGKALCYDYKGLSEYADVILYEKARVMGIKTINLGGGKDTVVMYKKKFPNAYEMDSFDIKATSIVHKSIPTQPEQPKQLKHPKHPQKHEDEDDHFIDFPDMPAKINDLRASDFQLCQGVSGAQYKTPITINGIQLTKKYIASLNREQREALIEPMFHYFRELGWIFPNFNPDILHESYKRLVGYTPDTSVSEVYNNVSLATDLCQYFCRNSFLHTTERKNGKIKSTLVENFLDDDKLRKICYNRLGLSWYDDPGERGETFNITPKMVMYQAQRSMRLVPQITIFKPGVAKLIYLKYSKENDTVYDYSAGFGSRLLGALSCNRRYIGIDPLTIAELKEMASFLNVPSDRYELICGKSEEYKGMGNSVDFAFSSPPYYDQEFYSNDVSQAYNHGDNHFYNTYWRGTLRNAKSMLKNGKLFGLNVSVKYPKMLKIAQEYFDKPIEIFNLRTVRSHLNKTGKDDAQKMEPVYIFENKGK